LEDLDRRAVVEWECVVGAGLSEPEVDELAQLVWLLLGEVV
jgi:hypothetical protein